MLELTLARQLAHALTLAISSYRAKESALAAQAARLAEAQADLAASRDDITRRIATLDAILAKEAEPVDINEPERAEVVPDLKAAYVPSEADISAELKRRHLRGVKDIVAGAKDEIR